jgi:hypothetical protein
MKDGDDLLRTAMRRRVLAPVVAFDLRMSLLTGMLALPLLPVSMLLIFVVPQLQDTLSGNGGLGPAWDAWVRASRWISEWWWMLVVALVVPFSWYLLVAQARLLVQVSATRPDGPDAIERGAAIDAGDPNQSPRPPFRPDCDPATTTPPTA